MRSQARLTALVVPLCVIALRTALCAQGGSIVVPPSAANADGNSLDNDPFGFDQVRHVQYVHQSLLAGLAPNTLIKELAYRRDGSTTNLPMFVRSEDGNPVPPVWQLRLGNLPASFSITQPPPEFPLATAANWTTVFPATQFDFPDLPLTNGAGNPQNFDIKFPLPAVFQFTGPHLGIEHYAYETTNFIYAYFFDAVDAGGTGGSVGPIGAGTLGCPSNQNRAYGASSYPGGGDLVLTLFGAESSRAAFACLGTSLTQWGALPLPLDLSTRLLLPGCWIYTDLAVVVPTTTSFSGAAEMRTPIPASAALAGGVLYGQWFARDARVNPLVDLATSDGLRITIGTGIAPQMSVVSTFAELATGPFGLVQPGRGLVVRIGW